MGVRLSYPQTWPTTNAIAVQKWWNWDKLRRSWRVCLWLSLAECSRGVQLKLVGVLLLEFCLRI